VIPVRTSEKAFRVVTSGRSVVAAVTDMSSKTTPSPPGGCGCALWAPVAPSPPGGAELAGGCGGVPVTRDCWTAYLRKAAPAASANREPTVAVPTPSRERSSLLLRTIPASERMVLLTPEWNRSLVPVASMATRCATVADESGRPHPGLSSSTRSTTPSPCAVRSRRLMSRVTGPGSVASSPVVRTVWDATPSVPSGQATANERDRNTETLAGPPTTCRTLTDPAKPSASGESGGRFTAAWKYRNGGSDAADAVGTPARRTGTAVRAATAALRRRHVEGTVIATSNAGASHRSTPAAAAGEAARARHGPPRRRAVRGPGAAGWTRPRWRAGQVRRMLRRPSWS
jgi:hypothetical protein